MKLIIQEVSKSYSGVKALDKLDVVLEYGIHGLVGANGAGKTTLMNLIAGNLKPDEGTIYLEYSSSGIPVRISAGTNRFRELLGYMPQQQWVYLDMNCMQFLNYIAALKGCKYGRNSEEILELLGRLNLYEHRNKRIGSLSGGMKQRIVLAQALLGNPKILILDEPTAGLDPSERIRIRNYIAELSRDRIILLATHVVSDIECIATNVLLLQKGRLVQHGTPEALIEGIYGKVAELPCRFEELHDLQQKYRTGNLSQRRSGLQLRLVGENIPEHSRIITEDISLEDVYLYYLREGQ